MDDDLSTTTNQEDSDDLLIATSQEDSDDLPTTMSQEDSDDLLGKVLHVDVLGNIVCYLSTKDILQCSLVSISWRDAFNKDEFWKKICVKHNLIATVQYLCETPCRVDPIFVEPKSRSEKLEPICEWRINLMRVQHLISNWVKGKCNIYKLPSAFHLGRTILGDKFMFLCKVGKCHAFNTENQSFLTSIIHFPLQNSPVDYLAFKNKRLLIVQLNLLQVYTLEERPGDVEKVIEREENGIRDEQTEIEFVPRFTRLIDEPELRSLEIPNCLPLDGWYFDIFGRLNALRMCSLLCEEINGIFIALETRKQQQNEFTLHVWDLTSGTKHRTIVVARETKPFRFAFIQSMTLHMPDKEGIYICVTSNTVTERVNDQTDYTSCESTIYKLHSLTSTTVETRYAWIHDHLTRISDDIVTIEYTKKTISFRDLRTSNVFAEMFCQDFISSCVVCNPAIILDTNYGLKLAYNQDVLPCDFNEVDTQVEKSFTINPHFETNFKFYVLAILNPTSSMLTLRYMPPDNFNRTQRRFITLDKNMTRMFTHHRNKPCLKYFW